MANHTNNSDDPEVQNLIFDEPVKAMCAILVSAKFEEKLQGARL